MRLSNGWTAKDYRLFRIVLAGYLLVHFAVLVPWGAELFSSAGLMPHASASPLTRVFPNVLAWQDSGAFVTALLVAAALATLPLALGRGDRVAAVFLWYVWACLLGRNPLISNPSLPFVGWLLLAHAAVPPLPRGGADARGWSLPPALFAAAWAVMALAYSYSGFTKLGSPSWLDGTAVAHVLANPLARPGLARDLALALPAPVLQAAAWGVLALELGYAPLALVRRLRPLLWASMLALHLGLIALIDFADLSLGMVMIHLFTFDPGWVRRRAPALPVADAPHVHVDEVRLGVAAHAAAP